MAKESQSVGAGLAVLIVVGSIILFAWMGNVCNDGGGGGGGGGGSVTAGIQRVGEAEARRLWESVPNTPGMQRFECGEDVCVVMFDPALWSQMTYDLKRDVVAGVGIGLAYGRSARWTEIRDMYTNDRLGRYSAPRDSVTID